MVNARTPKNEPICCSISAFDLNWVFSPLVTVCCTSVVMVVVWAGVSARARAASVVNRWPGQNVFSSNRATCSASAGCNAFAAAARSSGAACNNAMTFGRVAISRVGIAVSINSGLQ
jgi:hypothetical protein